MATNETKWAEESPDLAPLVWTEVVAKREELRPYERNPRKIFERQKENLRRSLREHGYHTRIKTTLDRLVVGGHQRLAIMGEMGMDEFPILVPNRQLTLREFRDILITDNLPFGIFDTGMLVTDFSREELIDYGMEEAYLPSQEKFTFAQGGQPKDPETTPDPEPVVITKPGDLWIMGMHRLLCGDATNSHDVATLLGAEKPNLMVTDPPYGVEYDPAWRREAGINRNAKKMGAVKNDHRADWREAWALFPGNIAYIWHADKYSPEVSESLKVCCFALRNLIVWAKDRLVLSRGDYHSKHEPCWYAVKETGNWAGDRKQTTLWDNIASREDAGHGHSTQKPLECMQRPMRNNSHPKDAVYDPFMGSGTTIIAAEMIQRRAFGLELNPAYVDICVRRWQNFTGRKATHALTGEEFTG